MSTTISVLLPFVILACTLTRFGVHAQQEVESPNGMITYYCPERETIEIAYQDYCPPDTLDGNALTATRQYPSYPNAPQSFQVPDGSYKLFCDYENSQRCAYIGGGGQPLADNGNAAYCREVSQVVPQPSPGVDYRKRTVFKRDQFAEARYSCPFTSSEGYSLSSNYLGTGSAAFDETLTYLCSISIGRGDITCFYDVDPNTGPTMYSSAPSDCPKTLCNAITTGSSNMRRGIFVGDDPYVERQAKLGRMSRREGRM